MINRREVLKYLGLSAVTLSGINAGATDLSPVLLDDKDPNYWDNVRDQFMLSKDKVFFNCGTVGVMPRAVFEKLEEHSRFLATHVAEWEYKDDNKEQFISGYNNLIPIRTKVAKLLNCEVGEIAMTDNVTNGMSYIANGITLQQGDEILTTDQEHGGGQSSWKLKEKRFGAVFKT